MTDFDSAEPSLANQAADAVRTSTKAMGEALEAAKPRFCCRVRKQDRVRHIGVERRGIHNSAAGLHVRYCSLCKVEHRVDIYLEGHFPFLIADVTDIPESRLMRGVGYKNVDASQFVDRFPNNGSTMFGILKVARDQDGSLTFSLDQLFDLLRILVFVQKGY